MRPLQWLSAIGLILGAAILVRAERLPLKIYTTADGLGHNAVERIVRDSRGFLWFCTFEGLSRFDGYGFTTYGIDQGLPSPVVHDLLETRSGEVLGWRRWGVCRFNPRGRPATRCKRRPTIRPHRIQCSRFTSWARMRIQEMCHRSSKTETAVSGVGQRRGLYRLEEQNRRGRIPLCRTGDTHSDHFNHHEDRHGAIWIGSINGIYRTGARGPWGELPNISWIA